jgi:general secretion pathway protein I
VNVLSQKMLKPTSSGFTLIEVMVALMIVAVALPALLSLVITQMDSAGSIRETSYAYWVAENQLNRYKLLQRLKQQKILPDYQLPENEKGKDKMLNLDWRWEFTSKEMDTLEVKGFKKIEVAVWSANSPESAMGKQPEPLARLVGYVSDPEQNRN